MLMSKVPFGDYYGKPLLRLVRFRQNHRFSFGYRYGKPSLCFGCCHCKPSVYFGSCPRKPLVIFLKTNGFVLVLQSKTNGLAVKNLM